MLARSRCPKCQEQARFWLIDPPEQDTQERINRSHLFIYPTPPLNEQLEDGIAEISPDFVRIYNQALTAEALGLHDLNGMAYRKSLEFLIKDYAYRKFPGKEADIKKKPLGKVIDEYIEAPNLKQSAKRAVWLGNDETHYIRKWEEKDINDLKTLLQITRYWISMEYLTHQFTVEMPEGQ